MTDADGPGQDDGGATLERMPDRMKVFVSYSRDDLEFADQLVMVLDDMGYEPLIDRRKINPGEPWQERLRALLTQCDTVVFVLTKGSLDSDACAWEVSEARALGKRMIPVLPASIEGLNVPPDLSLLNYIHFYPEKSVPSSGFYGGQKRLDQALKQDLAWLRQLTRLSERAAEWSQSRPDELLLLGRPLAEARAWAERTPKDQTVPPPVREYLNASEDLEARRNDEARKELEDRAAALKDREDAVKGRAEEQAKRKKSDARLRWVSFASLAGGVALIAGALALLWYAGESKAAANDRTAEQYAQASYESLQDGDPATAAMIALAGHNAVKNGWLESFFRPEGYPAIRLALVRARAQDLLVQRVRTEWGYDPAVQHYLGDHYYELAAMPGGKKVAAFKEVSSLGFSEDSDPIESSTYTVEIWEPGKTEPELLQPLPGEAQEPVVLSDGERILLNLQDDSGSEVVLWSLEKGEAVRTFPGAAPPFAISDDGAFALTGTSDCEGGLLWSLTDPAAKPAPRPLDEDSCVGGVAFQPGLYRHMVGDTDGQISIWANVGEAPSPESNSLSDFRIADALWLQEDLLVVGSQGAFGSVSLESGSWMPVDTLQRAFVGDERVGDHDFEGLSASPNNNVLLAKTSEGVRLIKRDLSQTYPLRDRAEKGQAGLFLPGFNMLATVDDAGLAFWQADVAMRHDWLVDSRATGPSPRAGFPVQFAGDDFVLLTDTDKILLKRVGEPGQHHSWGFIPFGYTVSPDRKLVAAAHDKVYVSDTKTGASKTIPSTMAVFRENQPLIRETGSWKKVGGAFSADSTHIAFRFDEQVSLWRIGDKSPLATFEARDPRIDSSLSSLIALAPDHSHIALAFEGYAELWNVKDGKPTRLCDEPARQCFMTSGKIEAIAFDNTGKRIAIANDSGGLVLFGFDGERLQSFVGSERISDIKFSANGQMILATGGMKATLWDLADRRALQTFDIPGIENAVATLGLDGKSVLAGSDISLARLEISAAVFQDMAGLEKGACAQAAMRGFDGFNARLMERYGVLSSPDNPCVALGLAKPPAAMTPEAANAPQ